MSVSIAQIKEFLSKILGITFEEESATVAKNRLKLVLVHDRVKISPQQMEQLKQDLIGAISKYVEIDKDQLEVSLTRKKKMTSLVVNIPVKVRKKEKITLRRPQSSQRLKKKKTTPEEETL